MRLWGAPFETQPPAAPSWHTQLSWLPWQGHTELFFLSLPWLPTQPHHPLSSYIIFKSP